MSTTAPSLSSALITNAPGHRREPRYRIRLPLTLWQGRRRRVETQDVSAAGLFVESETSPPDRTLVRFALRLPPDDREFVAHGMAVHAIDSGNPHERSPGFGIALYALDRDARARWDAFVAHVRERAPASVPPVEILYDEPVIIERASYAG